MGAASRARGQRPGPAPGRERQSASAEGRMASPPRRAYAVAMATTLHATRFGAFYQAYRDACRALGVAPLAPAALIALLQLMLERERTTLH